MDFKIYVALWGLSGFLFWIKIIHEEWKIGFDICLDLLTIGIIMFTCLGPICWIINLFLYITESNCPIIIKNKRKIKK